jgi:(R,R)-butanediol dehydrogenase/meso-butanediol dehydrogenase/diacetyl reductase
MRAAIFHRSGRPLSIEQVPDPTPAPMQVVIKVGRCGICGTDLSMTGGGSMHYEYGSALGHEFAGEVVDLGHSVDSLRIGDRVSVMPVSGCGACPACSVGDLFLCSAMRPMMGGFGEYTLANQSSCMTLPAGHSLEDGAIVEPLAVGLHSARLAGIHAGTRVLIMGSGPIALATAFWARRFGATSITLMARSGRHRAIAEQMGITDIVSFEPAVNPSANWDCVLECTGAVGMLGRAIDHVRPRGTVLVSGLCLESDVILPAAAVLKEAVIRTALGYTLDEFKASLDVLTGGEVAPRSMVTETIPLTELPARFETLRTNRSACKVLVDPWLNS